jgi:penicillin-binding protein 1A
VAEPRPRPGSGDRPPPRPGGRGSRRAPARRRGDRGRRRHPVASLALLLVLWAAIIGGGVLGYFAMTLPDTSGLTHSERRPSITILASDGSPVATYGDLFGRALTLKEMAPCLPQAVIATEDRRFYSHFGVDPIGLLRAAAADLAARHIVEGGSTITQQLAKNLFLTPERSLSRKIREILLALWLERRFSKDQILEIYLNRVYLGAGAYGVDAAARRYFGKSAAQLSLYQCAVVAGLLKAPTRLSPARDPDLTRERAAQVLENLVEAGYITKPAAAAAEREGNSLAAIPERRAGIRYFADWVVDQLPDFVAAGNRDLTVVTTLDPRLQREAEEAIGDTLARDGGKARAGEAALVAMSPDGAVRAMVGGRDYNQSQFNRATQAERQPGSAFKPFVYLAGLEAGLRPDDHFFDGPIQIGNWQPRDYTHRYLGDVTMAEGLAQSLNTVSVEIAERAGIGKVVAVARRLGITSQLAADASIALGTSEVNLLELVSAYAPFANGGSGVLPYGIREIRNTADGRVLFRRGGSGPGPVVGPDDLGMMNRMLTGVIDHGTGRAARLPRPAAGKTGTTQDYRDAWFIGYTAGLVAGVWFGNDDNSPMNKVTGGSLPARTWSRFMLAATRGTPVRPLPEGAPVMLAAGPARPVGPGLFGRLIELLSPGPAPSGQPAPEPGDRSLRGRGG